VKGTLTMNKMVIQDETPIYSTSENQYTMLRYAAMAAKWKGIHVHNHLFLWFAAAVV
jgi:hypothetical protein